MPPFAPGVVNLNGRDRKYIEWLPELVNAGDVEGTRRLMERVLLDNPNISIDPVSVKIHAERIAGLNQAQSAWVANLFARLLADRNIASAVVAKNPNVTLQDAFAHARSLRIAASIESMMVGPKSVILATVDPKSSMNEVADLVNSLTTTLGVTVVVKPDTIELRRLDIADLVKLRTKLDEIINDKQTPNPPGGGQPT